MKEYKLPYFFSPRQFLQLAFFHLENYVFSKSHTNKKTLFILVLWRLPMKPVLSMVQGLP